MEMVNAASYMNNYYYQYWMNWMKQMATSGDGQADPSAVGMTSMAGMPTMAGMPADMISASGMPSMADMPSSTGMPSMASMPMMDDASYTMPVMPPGMVPPQMGSPGPPPPQMGSPHPPGGMRGMMPHMPRGPMQMSPRPNRPRFNGNPDGYCNYGNPMYGGGPPRPGPGPPRPGPPRPPMPRHMRPPRPNFQQPRMPQPSNYTHPNPRPAQPFCRVKMPDRINNGRNTFMDAHRTVQRNQADKLAQFDRHGNPIKYKYVDDPPKTAMVSYTSACLYCDLHFNNKTDFLAHLRGFDHRIRLKQVALQLVTRLDNESDSEAERRGEFCKICDHRFHSSAIEHMEDKEHLRKLRLVRRGCVLCGTGPFDKYPEYINHLSTEDHKLKKLDLDELTVERTNRRRHVKEELSSRRSHFFMERPGDHIVLDAVGIFDEDHSSSGESDRPHSHHRSLSSDRSKNRDRRGSDHRSIHSSRTQSHRSEHSRQSSRSPSHGSKRRCTRWSRIDDSDDDDEDESERSVSISGDNTDDEENKSDSEEAEKRSCSEEEFDYEEDIEEEEDPKEKSQQQEDVTVISDESDDEPITHSQPKTVAKKKESLAVASNASAQMSQGAMMSVTEHTDTTPMNKRPLWAATRTGRNTAQLLKRLRLMRQKNKRAIGRLLPENAVKTSEPPAEARHEIKEEIIFIEEMDDNQVEEHTTSETTLATESTKTMKTKTEPTTVQGRNGEETLAVERPKLKKNNAVGKANKKTKLVPKIARETRQSTAKKAANYNEFVNDTNALGDDNQESDSKYNETELKATKHISEQNMPQAMKTSYRVNESVIVEHVWAKQKLSETTLKEKTLKKAKQGTPLVKLVKTSRKHDETLTIVSAKELRSKRTKQKQEVIKEILPDATNECLSVNQTDQKTSHAVVDLQPTSVEPRPKWLLRKQAKKGRQQKVAKAKSKPNWAYMMLRQRRKEPRPVTAPAVVNPAQDNGNLPSEDELPDSLDKLQPAQINSKPTEDETTADSFPERPEPVQEPNCLAETEPCKRNRMLGQTKKRTLPEPNTLKEAKHSEMSKAKISKGFRTKKKQTRNKSETTADGKDSKPGSYAKQARKEHLDDQPSPVEAVATGIDLAPKATSVLPALNLADTFGETQPTVTNSHFSASSPVKSKRRACKKSKETKTTSIDRSSTPDELKPTDANVSENMMDTSGLREPEVSNQILGESSSPKKARVSKKLKQVQHPTVRRCSTRIEAEPSQPDATPTQHVQESLDEPIISAEGNPADRNVAVKQTPVESLRNEDTCVRAETTVSHMIAANSMMRKKRLVIEVEQLTDIPGVHDISDVLQCAKKVCLTKRNGRKRIGPKCKQTYKRAKQTCCESTDSTPDSLLETADNDTHNLRKNDQESIQTTAENSETGIAYKRDSKPVLNLLDEDSLSDNDITLAELKAKEVEQPDHSKETNNVNPEPYSLNSDISQCETDSYVPVLKTTEDKQLDHSKENDTKKQGPASYIPDKDAVRMMLSDTDSSLTQLEGNRGEQLDQNKTTDKVKRELASNLPGNETVSSDIDVSLTQQKANDNEQPRQNNVHNKVKQEPASDHHDSETVMSDKDVSSRVPGANEPEQFGVNLMKYTLKQELLSNSLDEANTVYPANSTVAEMVLNEDKQFDSSKINDDAMRKPTPNTMDDRSLLSDINTSGPERSNREDQQVDQVDVNDNTKVKPKVVRLRRMPVLKVKRTKIRRRNLTVSLKPRVIMDTANGKEETPAETKEETTNEQPVRLEHADITPSVESTSPALSDTMVKREPEVHEQNDNALPPEDTHKIVGEVSPPPTSDHEECVPNKELRPLVYPYDDDDREADDQDDRAGSKTSLVHPYNNEDKPRTPQEESNHVSSLDTDEDGSKHRECSDSEHEKTDNTNQTNTTGCQDDVSGISTNVNAVHKNIPTTGSSGSVDDENTKVENRKVESKLTDDTDQTETKQSDDATKSTHPADKVTGKYQLHCMPSEPEDMGDRSNDEPPLLAPEMPMCETQHHGSAEDEITYPTKEGDMLTSNITESSGPTPPDLTSPDDPSYDPHTSIGQQYIVQVSGYFCRLCHKFYNNEDMAKVTHCRTEKHFQKYQMQLKIKSQRKKKTSESPTDSKSVSPHTDDTSPHTSKQAGMCDTT